MKNPFLSVPNLVKGSILNSATRLANLARVTGWSKRTPKKLHAITLVRGVLQAVGRGESSFRLLCQSIGLHLGGETDSPSGSDGRQQESKHSRAFATISKPGLWKRINGSAVEFFEEVLRELMKQSAGKTREPSSESAELPGISRILGEDSSLIQLHKSLADEFPATENQNATKGAGLRQQAVFDLVSGRPVHLRLTEYLRNDQSAAFDVVPHLEPGDLLLRDLGYLVTGALGQIVDAGAHFVSRLHSNWLVHQCFEDGAEKIDLVKYLQTHASDEGDTVDIKVGLGPKLKGAKRFECRLVARKVPARVLQDRLKKIARDEKRLGKQRSKKHKKLQGWEIYITSLDREAAPVEKICEVYGLRWRIETIFKAFKSYTALKKIAKHHTNANHIQVLLYGWLCLVVAASDSGAFALARQTGPRRELQPNRVSLLKVTSKVFELATLTLMLSSSRSVRLLLRRWMAQIEYHDRYEKRKKRTSMAEQMANVLGIPDCELVQTGRLSENQPALS